MNDDKADHKHGVLAAMKDYSRHHGRAARRKRSPRRRQAAKAGRL